MRPSRTIVALSTVAALSVPLVAASAFAASNSNDTLTVAAPVVAEARPAAAPSAAATAAAKPTVAKPKVTKPTATSAKPVANRTTTRRVTVRPPAPVATKAPVRKPAATTAPAPKPTATTAPAPKPAATTASKAGGDDYPYRTATGNSADRWGFTMRQCVSFAAWRLAQRGKALDNRTQNWGSAFHWDETARARGIRISTAPRVGAIAQWNANESSTTASGGRFTAGSYGHVGYVAAVYSDGTALIEQYNLGGDRSYASYRMKAPRYLLF